ncbi:MAG TPA: PilN domain-containing protein [Anaerolineae bacterium]|nr:PilN domain-containing protein [Anaerolineae bacterium]
MSAQRGRAGASLASGEQAGRRVVSVPGQVQPRGLPRTVLVLWLVVLGLAILFIPLYLSATTIQTDAERLQAELAVIQASLTSVPTPIPEVQALLSTLTVVEGQIGQAEAVSPTLTAANLNWPAVMSAIGSYSPGQIAITSLTQTGSQLTLNGRATDELAVVNYARGLEASTLFSRVIVQSIRVIATPFVTPSATITGTPTLTATATPTPTLTSVPTATPTPTPNPRDEYEPDDSQPRAIAFGQPQSRNFYPSGDVDNASFLAKNGRFYRVFTSDLAPGVDTLLTVSVGDAVHVNDDARPGLLSSEVAFQVTGPDSIALIRITNRGQFGPDQRYTLSVEEIVPTPTGTTPPTPIPPTPTPTNTNVPPPTPTNTGIPSVTPTPTSDLRDSYEVDDVVARSIAISETQTHNFYPNADLDKVSFIAKAGRRYQVLTSDLALGVDTYLVVDGGGGENDDYDSPGSGNFASVVCFQATLDRTTTVTITNVARQYDPAKTYKITVREIPNPNTPPCPAPPSAAAPARAFGAAGLGPSLVWTQAAGLLPIALQPAYLWPALDPPAADRQTQPGPSAVEFVIIVEIRVPAP